MKAILKSIYRNDRYKVIAMENGDYYLLDTDDRKITILFGFLGAVGYHEVQVISEDVAGNLQLDRSGLPLFKNANNKFVLYGFLLGIFTWLISFLFPSLSILIPLILAIIGILGIKLLFSHQEKKNLLRITGPMTKETVQIHISLQQSWSKRLKITLSWLFLSILSLFVIANGYEIYSVFLSNIFIYTFLIVGLLALVLLFSRSAFPEGEYRIKFKEKNKC